MNNKIAVDMLNRIKTSCENKLSNKDLTEDKRIVLINTSNKINSIVKELDNISEFAVEDSKK